MTTDGEIGRETLYERFVCNAWQNIVSARMLEVSVSIKAGTALRLEMDACSMVK